MKTTMEIYPGNRVEKLSKKQRRIKKSISTYARKLHASEVKIVFYWEEVRNAYWHKKTISKEMYEKRSAEIAARRKSL